MCIFFYERKIYGERDNDRAREIEKEGVSLSLSLKCYTLHIHLIRSIINGNQERINLSYLLLDYCL